MPNDAVPPVTDEQWMHWQKLVSDEHGRQEAEIAFLRSERDKFEMAWNDVSSRYEALLNQLGATDA